jgi:ABC-type multidrug transport system fused ATPase/permease subunit
LITLLGIIGFLFVVNSAMAMGVILYFIFLSFFVTRITGRWLSGPSSEMTTSSIESRQNLRDILSLFREITLFQKRNSFSQEFVGHRTRAIDSYVRVNWIQQLPKYILESSVIIGSLGIVTVYSRFSGISSAVSNLIIFMVASSRLVPSVLRLQSFLLQVRASEKSANYSFTLMKSLNYFDELSILQEVPESKEHSESHPLAIEAKNLSFRYPGASTDAISAVSLRIKPGEFVALVGPSGSGKSTLADLLLGFLQPSAGQVVMSGTQVNPSTVSPTPRLAYMPQKVLVFSGSLLENIVMDRSVSAPDVKLAEIAAIRAGLGDWLQSQAAGIHTLLTETNSPLSGGERQRIGLARVFYANPDLLILDEPTSSLDTGTEDHVMENVLKLRGVCTIIVIAHRLSTIQKVDRVIRIKEGKIEWEGSYVELLE